jgi:hypothetical protein
MNQLSRDELNQITMLVDGYLRHPGAVDQVEAGQHLDEDTLNAFVEGALSEAEAEPLVRHVVECGLCRGFTGQLVRLAMELGEIDENQRIVEPEPSNIRQFLSALAARIGLAPDDDTVFAYHAPAEDFRPKDETEKKTDDDPHDSM